MQDTGDPSPLPSPNWHRYPKTIMAVGIVWIIIGAGILADLPMSLLSQFSLLAEAHPGGREVFFVVIVAGGLFRGVVGCFFLYEGISSCRGTIPSTVGIAVGSLLCALIFFGLGLFRPEPDRGYEGALQFSAALVLFVAGVLALVGRAQYDVWWKAHRHDRRKRRHNMR